MLFQPVQFLNCTGYIVRNLNLFGHPSVTYAGIMITQTLALTLLMQLARFDGQVRDARTHREIASAKIEASSAQLPMARGYSNDSGRFRFDNLPPGYYVVSVQSPGYDSAMIEVNVPTTNPGSIIIELTRSKTQPENTAEVMPLNRYLVPRSAQKEFDDARKKARQQDCAKAVTHFENGLRIFGQDAPALNDLGNCYRKLGMLEPAEEVFKRAREMDNSVYIAMNLAEVYTAQKRFKDAESVLTEVIRTSPRSGDAYYALAAVYFDQGRLAEAEAAAVEADSRSHTIADLHLLLAKIYARNRRPEVVVTQLELYLKEDPHGRESARVREALKNAR